jgi:nucleotide-binding universal stress UspA family protein
MTILAAYVPTAEGRAVLEAAVAEARRRDDRLVVARHVEDQGAPKAPLVGSEGQRETKIREDLDAIGDELKGQGIKAETLMLSEGKDASQELLDLAGSMNVDLIVIGVRRRSPVGKAFLGSDAQDILLNADCPVLAVKAG